MAADPPTTLPATPAGDATRALLALFEKWKADAPAPIDFSAFDGSVGVVVDDPPPADQRQQAWMRTAERIGGGRIVAADERGPHEVRLVVDPGSGDGRLWELTVTVEDTPPYRIIGFRDRQALAEGMVTRAAVPADGPALDRLDREDPIAIGDVTIRVERSSDYFDSCRLMNEGAFVVADHAGRIVGLMGGSVHPARIGGVHYRMGYSHRLRIHPEYQGQGIWSHLADAFYERYPMGDTLDCSYGYVNRDNEVMQRAWRDLANKWPVGPSRFLLECAAVEAGSPSARVATVDDIGAIVEVLNVCHDGEEVYAPQTVESFSGRVERAPDLYSIDDVLISDTGGAVVGVWPAGRHAETVIESPAGTRRQRRAVAVDHGFRPGREQELESLLREWCARLAADGLTHLLVYSSPLSPGWDLFGTLASDREDFDYWTPQIPVPPDAASRGVYLDPIYF